MPTIVRGWSTRDWWALAGVLVVAAATRGVALGEPDRPYFDESFYAVDSCGYVLAIDDCGPDQPASELTTLHPPLGKWLIGAGIEAFGYRPFGWRVASAVAGVATVGLLFLLARRLAASRTVAILASGLFAIDFLHIVHSRIAMLDVFLTLFLVAAAVCWERDRSSTRAWSSWRLAAGACLGLAMATKWTAAGGVIAIVGLTVAGLRRDGDPAAPRPWRRILATHGLSLAVAFVVVPGVVYALTYVGRLDASAFAAPWAADSWPRTFLGRQRGMLSADLAFGHKHHPGSSPAWSWPLLKRPVTYYFDVTDSGRVREILGIGNPLLWWSGLAALATAGVRLARRRASDLERLAVAAFAALYLPLLLLGIQRSFTFLYYLLPALPFLYLALADILLTVLRRGRRAMTAAVVVVAVGSFAFFAPVLYAVSLPYDSWRDRIIFDECGEVVGQFEVDGTRRDVPAFEVVAPPDGWCWL